MKRLALLARLMPYAEICDGDQLIADDFRDGPTALRVAVRVDCVPDWFALVGMLREFGPHVKRYRFYRTGAFPAVQTLCLDFEEGYRDRASTGHDSLFHASCALRSEHPN